MKWIYKLTFPNGKIYVGMDLTGSVGYFSSPHSPSIAADFTAEQQRDMTIRREIIWSSGTATDADVRAKEIEYIKTLRSSDPADWIQPDAQIQPSGKLIHHRRRG